VAEKAGKHVSLLVVPGTNVFDAIAQTVAQLDSADIWAGRSSVMEPDDQAKYIGEAWERLAKKPDRQVCFHVVDSDGTLHDFNLGAHVPTLMAADVDMIHTLWLAGHNERSTNHHLPGQHVSKHQHSDNLRNSKEHRDVAAQKTPEMQAALVHQNAIHDKAGCTEKQERRTVLKSPSDEGGASKLQEGGADENGHGPNESHPVHLRNSMMCWRDSPGTKRSNVNPSASTSVRASATLI
jgi:hypothetical protein